MSRTRFSIGLLALIVACTAEEPTAPDSLPSEVAAAKPPKPGSGGTDSRAIWEFHATLSDGATATRLVGDGLAANGVDPADPSVYEGGRCAVRATISWYASNPPSGGEAFFAPAGGTQDADCPDGRTLAAVFDDGVHVIKWTTTIQQLMQLALDESRLQDVMFGPTNTLPCSRLIYSAEAGSQVRVTRTAGNQTDTTGEWWLESAGNHEAGCYVFARGNKLTYSGTNYYLPFRVRMLELRAEG